MSTKSKIAIKQVLATNSSVALWALLRVYQNQNETERITGEATELNGQGFSKLDSKILTSLSQFLLSRGYLTPKQTTVLHLCVPKYWRQVVEGLNSPQLDDLLKGIVPTDPILPAVPRINSEAH